MRPLAVLIFIMGAVAALVFAFVSVSSDGSRSSYAGGPATDGVTRPAEDPAPQPGALEERDEIVPQAPQLGDGGGRKVATGGGQGGYLNEVYGVVRTHEGVPVEGAVVKLASASGTSQIGALAALAGNPQASSEPKRRTQTNEEGRYRFANVEPGNDWALIASHPEHGHRRVSGVDVPAEGRVEEVIDLLPGFRIFGRVRDRDSRRAIPDAVITLEDPLTFLMPAKKRDAKKKETVSDAQGFYEFKNVSRDNPLLICTAEGFATQIHNDLSTIGNKEKQLEVNCEMVPGLPIAGRVVGPDLTGIPDVHIDAVCHTGDTSCRGETLSTEDGEFLIEDLGEGVYTLRVTAEGWDCDPYVRIEAGTTDVTIQLFEQGLVAGKVVDGATGRPVQDFRILVRVDHPNSEIFGPVKAQRNFRGSTDGSFEIGGLSQGNYLIQADAPGFASSFSEDFTITQGLTTSDVTVRMRKGGVLVGAVHDSYSGAPIAGASVSTHENNWIDSEFTRLLSGTMPMPLTLKTVKTGEDGSFQLPLMTPGNYQVRIQHAEYNMQIRNDVRIADGGQLKLEPFLLTRGALVRGTVFGANGQQARGMSVFLRPTNGDPGRSVTTRSDANGHFLLKNVSPGIYKLSATRPHGDSGGSPFDAILDMRNSEVEITLADGQEYTQDLYMGSNH